MSKYRIDMERSGIRNSADPVLVSSILLLLGIGLVTLYSASIAFAERFFFDSYYFVRRQAIFAGFGLLLFFIASKISLDVLRKCIKPLVLGTIILCILPFIPGIGITRNGASRWIQLGFTTYQPSEMVKLVLPIYLAHIFDKKKNKMDELSAGVLPQTLITVLFFLIIYLQNNFSTASFIALNALVLFFLAGVRLRYFLAVSLLIGPLSVLLVFTKEHRLRRLISFLSPEWDPLGAGYQVRSSVISIASGSFWGKGLGQGTRKISSVPEIHSDFVFSAYAEEGGFIAVLLFFALMFVFAFRSYKAALSASDSFRRLLGCGLSTMICSQALLNVGVVSGALPATGIPLPFFSAGGSSLATMLFAAGLIVNVSRQNEKMESAYV